MSQFVTSISPMPRGYAGQLTRGFFDNTVETKVADGAVGFGVAVTLDSGKAKATSAASDDVYGISLREYGQADMPGDQAEKFVAVLRRGYVAVKAAGTPAAGGAVYLNSSGAITADSSSTTKVPNAVFCGAADADGIVEIAFNI